jgi:hypothetical protein
LTVEKSESFSVVDAQMESPLTTEVIERDFGRIWYFKVASTVLSLKDGQSPSFLKALSFGAMI